MADEQKVGTDVATGDAAQQANKTQQVATGDAQAGQQAAASTPPEVKTGETAAQALLPKTDAVADAAKHDWPKYTDQSLGAASGLMKDAGLAYADAIAIFQKARTSGNLADVDTKALEAKIGADKAALVMVGVKDYYTRQTDLANKTVSEIHAVMGGKDGFAKVQAWVAAKEAADPAFAADMKVYRDMVNAGGVSARSAATDIMRQYTADPNNSGLKTKMVNGDSAPGATGAEPLNRSDYVKLLKEAHSKGDKTAIASLNDRRKAGMKLNLK